MASRAVGTFIYMALLHRRCPARGPAASLRVAPPARPSGGRRPALLADADDLRDAGVLPLYGEAAHPRQHEGPTWMEAVD